MCVPDCMYVHRVHAGADGGQRTALHPLESNSARVGAASAQTFRLLIYFELGFEPGAP